MTSNMYKPSKVKNKRDILSFINNNDIYNSGLLILSKDTNLSINNYLKNKSDTRIDITTTNIYGLEDKATLSFLYLINKYQDDEDYNKKDKVSYIDNNEVSTLVLMSMK